MPRSNLTRINQRAILTVASSQDEVQSAPCIGHFSVAELPCFNDLIAAPLEIAEPKQSAEDEKAVIRQAALRQLDERIANLRERYAHKDWLPYPELLKDAKLSAYAEKWGIDYEGVLMTCCCSKMAVCSDNQTNRRTRQAMKKWFNKQPVTYADLRVEVVCALKSIVEHKTGQRHLLP